MIAYERLLPLCWILLLCQVALVGCGDRDKVEPYQIDKLRVLAIRASAPEVTTDEPLVVDALVVGAEGEVTYEWRLCPFAGPGFLGFPCFSDDIPEEVKGQRLQHIIALQEQISLEVNQKMVGQTVTVLVEGPSKRKNDQGQRNNYGRSQHGKVVVFPQDAAPNNLVQVQVERTTSHTLFGNLIN